MNIIEHFLTEQALPDLKIGDTILTGKWKNKRCIIKGFAKDKNNQPIVKTDKGDVSIFHFRIASLMPPKKDKK